MMAGSLDQFPGSGLADYVRNDVDYDDGVYFLRDHERFDYSDGKSVEDYVLRALRSCQDVSSGSRELENYEKDWATHYHFARERATAFRSLSLGEGTRILEVGSGCGAISRYLGEQGCRLLSLEGSPARSRITRERTRDLDNVTVLCASFEDVQFSTSFDIVLCNGVLEYAPRFVRSETPFEQMLEDLSRLTADSGFLIVAIENQLGLRYFSSGVEEHTNAMYDGIEGYSVRPNQVRTFSRTGLTGLLKQQFPNVDLLIPLPDYKLPVAVIHPDLLSAADCGELFASVANYDFGAFVRPKIYERLAWQELAKADLLAEFSNSFFAVASRGANRLWSEEWLGDVYSLRRSRRWATRTRFSRDGTGVSTAKTYVNAMPGQRESAAFVHHVGSSSWQDGQTVHSALVRTLRAGGRQGLQDRIQAPVRAWWASVEDECRANGGLSGGSLDLIWQNAVIDGEGVVFIDREWEWRSSIDPIWLIYRCINSFMNEEANFTHKWGLATIAVSRWSMIRAVCRIIGETPTFGRLRKAIENELTFQQAVCGKRSRKPALRRSWLRLFYPVRLRGIRIGPLRTVGRAAKTLQRKLQAGLARDRSS